MEAEKTQGKTFADVLDGITSSLKKFLLFFGFVICCAALVLVGFWIVTKMLGLSRPKEVKEIRVSTTGAAILFETRSQNKSEYLVVVHPQGWQNTDIPVKNDDRISFQAGGNIAVDMYSIVKRTDIRHKLEDVYGKKLDKASTSPDQAPEYYFTDRDKESLRLSRGWIGPNGHSVMLTSQSFAARHRSRVLPETQLGALIGAIKDKNGPSTFPEQSEIFLIGTKKDIQNPPTGTLWFNVNDVLNENDPQNRDLFYADNIGFFWVKVVIEHAAP